MRQALLRLLKRPNVVSTLSTLITESGSRPLTFDYICPRCQASRTQHRFLGDKAPPVRIRHVRVTSPSFRVRDVRPSPFARSEEQEPGRGRPRVEDDGQSSSSGLGDLAFASDIGHLKDLDRRLVDDPARRSDFAFWEELLRHRQRHRGDSGALDIWEALTLRLEGVWLPVEGRRADFFWETFVKVGLRRPFLLNDIAEYALRLWQEKGQKWEGLYAAIVGSFLQNGHSRQALHWHQKLRSPHLADSNGLVKVLTFALSRDSPPATKVRFGQRLPVRRDMHSGLQAFRSICRTVDGHHIYAPVIATIIEHGLIADAVAMHEFLISRNDHPQTVDEIQPLLRSVANHGTRKMSRSLQDYVRRRFPLAQELPHAALDSVCHAAPENGISWKEDKTLKDDFGARLFATKAFSFEVILGGLQMFGVQAVGPLSLREMALRAGGCKDILNKLAELQKSGISIGDSVFARLIRRLSLENRDTLLHDILHSDQHPDAFEDAALQESLLVSFYLARDWRQYHMTLMILGELLPNSGAMDNVHFRKFVAAEEWAAASKMVDDLYLQGRMIDEKSVDFMVDQVLTPRRERSGPAQGRSLQIHEEVALLFRLLSRVASSGTIVPPSLWIELIKRLGMNGRWPMLRDCCLWIARHYAAGSKRTDLASPRVDLFKSTDSCLPEETRSRLLRDIFNPRIQGALVAWGFRMQHVPQRETTPDKPGSTAADTALIPWVRGLVLLREIQQHGIALSRASIRRACLARLGILFGPHIHSRKRLNRALRRENPYSLEQVVHDIDRAWGEPLFVDQERRDVSAPVTPPVSIRDSNRHREEDNEPLGLNESSMATKSAC